MADDPLADALAKTELLMHQWTYPVGDPAYFERWAGLLRQLGVQAVSDEEAAILPAVWQPGPGRSPFGTCRVCGDGLMTATEAHQAVRRLVAAGVRVER